MSWRRLCRSGTCFEARVCRSTGALDKNVTERRPPEPGDEPPEAPETPPDEPQPVPVQDPPAEPTTSPYVVARGGR